MTDEIREAIRKRDEAAAALVAAERRIAELSRTYADWHGLTLRPRLEQLRRMVEA